MKIYLTSTFANVANDFVSEFGLNPKQTRVAFIENASDPYSEHPWTQTDRDSLTNNGFLVEDIDLRKIQGDELEQKLDDCDVIFLAGGNTAYLCKMAQESGLNGILNRMKNSDKIYVGSSAGSILAGPSVEPIYKSDKAELAELGQDIELTDLSGIDLVDFVVLPHTNKESYRKEFEVKVIPKYNDRFKFKTLTDDQALVIEI